MFPPSLFHFNRRSWKRLFASGSPRHHTSLLSVYTLHCINWSILNFNVDFKVILHVQVIMILIAEALEFIISCRHDDNLLIDWFNVLSTDIPWYNILIEEVSLHHVQQNEYWRNQVYFWQLIQCIVETDVCVRDLVIQMQMVPFKIGELCNTPFFSSIAFCLP